MEWTHIVRGALALVGLYLGAGVVVAAFVHARGLASLDPATRGAGLGFRLLITPGLIALWPWMLRAWGRVRRGEPVAGERPMTPSPPRLQAAQRLLWRVLLVLIPLGMGWALYLRPPLLPVPPLPEPPSTPYLAP